MAQPQERYQVSRREETRADEPGDARPNENDDKNIYYKQLEDFLKQKKNTLTTDLSKII